MSACPDGRDNIPGRLICQHITHVDIFVKKNICFSFGCLFICLFVCLFVCEKIKFTRSAWTLWIAGGEGPYHDVRIANSFTII